jgi:hydrogenase nickel incorporation protein HypB
MCKDCGCQGIKKEEKVFKINKSVTEVNDAIAVQNLKIFKKKKILCINLMGSPGSGKTTIIEGLAKFIDSKKIAVIQGDLESDIDKKRLEKSNIQTYQINTHSGCHLNASMINEALMDMDLSNKEYLIIENVGNLVCPAGVNLGQDINLIVSSTTEGSDKPKKYPVIFSDADIIVISKMDLMAAVGFDEKQYLSDLKNINGKALVIKTSSKENSSFKELVHEIKHFRSHKVNEHHHH